MKHVKTFGIIAAAIGLTVASGIWAGQLTYRWTPNKDLARAGNLLRDVPLQLGPWRTEGSEPFDDNERTVSLLQCGDGFMNCVYRNVQSDEVLMVALIAGPSGPMSVHRPEICLPNAGFQLTGSAKRVKIGQDERDEFFIANFRSPGAFGENLIVYYAWSDGRYWEAPDSPRFRFGGQPVLYKLQIASSSDGAEDDACERFLDEFLPVWRARLSYSSNSSE